MNTYTEVPSHLADFINKYYHDHVASLKEEDAREETLLIYKGIDIFLKFLNHDLKDAFCLRLDPHILAARSAFVAAERSRRGEDYLADVERFTRKMGEERSAKVFIGKDAYLLHHSYINLFPDRRDSFFIPYSRKYLFTVSNGNGYFEIVDLLYRVAAKSPGLKEFLVDFKQGLRLKEKLYYLIKTRSLKMLTDHHLLVELQRFDRVTVIDSGTQGGLIFPLMTVLTDEGFNCDFKLFSCFNWIYPLFSRHVFTKDLYSFIRVEHAGAKLYQKS